MVIALMGCLERLGAALVLIALSSCASAASDRSSDRSLAPEPSGEAQANGASKTSGQRPVVVVALIIDQLPMWMAEERWKTLPATGGFAKLLTEAVAVAELHHGHAHNSTAPGHAALFTGGTPHESGIVANARLDDAGARVSFLWDPTSFVLTSAGSQKVASSSLAALRAPTVADALREQREGAIIVSLSMKDRATLFGGGRKPDVALWFDAKIDGLVSSTAVTSEIAAWAAPFATKSAAERYRKGAWVPLDPKWLAMHTDLPAPDLGQGDYYGLSAKFPHDASRASNPARAFLATPDADAMVVDAAIAAIDAIEPRRTSSLLAVSLSSTDYIGHVFGPDAPEAWDQMARLDVELRRLLTHLDTKLGPGGYAVVLSSDHGVAPTPEVMNQGYCGRPDKDRFERRCSRAIRLSRDQLTKVAEGAADAFMGPGDWVLGTAEPFVVLRPEARALPTDKLDPLLGAISRALDAVPGVASAVDVSRLPATCPPLEDESRDALVCRSVLGGSARDAAKLGGPGSLFIVPEAGSFIDAGYVPGDGVNHGTPYLFDRAVPLVVRAPLESTPPPREIASLGFGAPASSSRTRIVVDQRAYAATLSGLLGITPPPAAVGGADLSKEVSR